MIVQGLVPSLKSPVALIGVAEKGYVTVELSVKGPGGHSSMPPVDKTKNLIGVMAGAVLKLENNLFPIHSGKDSLIRIFFERAAPHVESRVLKFLLKNLWLFGGILSRFLCNTSIAVAASMRTTTAVTKIIGGGKTNVLPQEVKVFVNHRIHPKETIE